MGDLEAQHYRYRIFAHSVTSVTYRPLFLGSGPEGDEVLYNTGGLMFFCLSFRLSPQALSGLKSAFSQGGGAKNVFSSF